MPHIDIPEGKADPEVRVWALRPEMGIGAGALSHAIYEAEHRARARTRARAHADRADQRLRDLPAVAVDAGRRRPGERRRLRARSPTGGRYAGYSERERLAIDYAERFALDHHAIDDDFFDRLRAAYSDAEILDLTVCIGGWLALGRTLHVLGLDEHCRLPG